MAGEQPEFTIRKSKDVFEWLVLGQHDVVCSLTQIHEAHQKQNSFRLASQRGDWIFRTSKKWSRYSVFKEGEESPIGEIRNNLGEEPDFFCDLYIDLCTYKSISKGHRWQVELKRQAVLQFGKPWKDSDLANQVCYQIYPTGDLDIRHREVLLVAPLFWDSMQP